ncbi:hypothetical protein NON20_13410 [Synechocystis sp. B12]|nr:hypothetical protein NON20_13410 [Synechocystis sp. B12]
MPGLDGTGKLFYRQRPELVEHFNLLALRLTPGLFRMIGRRSPRPYTN